MNFFLTDDKILIYVRLAMLSAEQDTFSWALEWLVENKLQYY